MAKRAHTPTRNRIRPVSLTNFGAGMETVVPDVRVVVRRNEPLVQCVSTRGFTFFKSTGAGACAVTVLLSVASAFAFFASTKPRARFATKSPNAARRVVVVVVVVVSTLFLAAPSCASPRAIKFYGQNCTNERMRHADDEPNEVGKTDRERENGIRGGRKRSRIEYNGTDF